MFRKTLVLVAILVLMLVLMAVPAMAVDGEFFGGGANASSDVSSGGGGHFCGIVVTGATNSSGATANVNWSGPQVEANVGTTTSGGTFTMVHGFAGGGAQQSGSANAGAGFHGFHFGH